jgi:hypothetical protein
VAKTLLATSDVNNTLLNGDFFSLFGYGGDSTTELNTQASCTEDAVFSRLGFRVITAGSGTSTLKLRKAAVNATETVSVTGAGSAEDTTNSDGLVAGDLFNIACTDTGTGSTVGWSKGNVVFAKGHGGFHGSASFLGATYGLASTTTFQSLGGPLKTNGNATEVEMAFKARGYDRFEALQVRVTANARTTDTTFRNRINNANGTGLITFTSGATGLVTATGLNDSIAAGQVIDVSVTTLTGVQNITVSLVLATLKSTINTQDIWAETVAGVARAAGASGSYHPLGGTIRNFTSMTESQARIKPGFTGRASNLRIYVAANTYSANGTLSLFKNGVAVSTVTITAAAQNQWFENTTDSISFNETDEFSYEIIGGTAGSITVYMIGVTLAADVNLQTVPNVRITTPYVGPAALRFMFRQPYLFYRVDGGPDAPDPVAGSNIAIGIVRISNLNVGPTALRQMFRQPYLLCRVDGGPDVPDPLPPSNFGIGAVRIATPYVGPSALRFMFRQPMLFYSVDGGPDIPDPLASINFGIASVRIANINVGPMALRQMFRQSNLFVLVDGGPDAPDPSVAGTIRVSGFICNMGSLMRR